MTTQNVINILINNMKRYESCGNAHSGLLRACWRWLQQHSPSEASKLQDMWLYKRKQTIDG